MIHPEDKPKLEAIYKKLKPLAYELGVYLEMVELNDTIYFYPLLNELGNHVNR